ncbi:MAG: carbon starvation protein A [Alphaproteobacteria bacterium]|nr:carbon starvation protein A [Alphaproteobacteria bacterium]
MIVFLLAVVCLISGYAVYGRVVEKVFGADEKKVTPAVEKCDNVDFMVLPTWRIFLIQFLNIAGLGPVFGAILGALYGPIALFWIVLGSIFAGGVHDYMAGMISVRNGGKSLVPLVEKYMGSEIKTVFLIFMVLFLLLLGAVFAMSPAHMIADLFKVEFAWCLAAVFLYYFLATLLPIDKIIGKFYPFFALLLIGVTVALMVVLFTCGQEFYPQLTLANLHPQGLPVFPLMFVTIACGALSGFHATQSPLMARCLQNEKYGRSIFYGAMITEGIVALMWATLGMAFYGGSGGLAETINHSGPGGVVSEVSKGFLGNVGGMFAIIAVILLSITSGDTAFRSARLTIADYWLKDNQTLKKRILISIFVLSGGIAMSFFDLTVIWTYFGWANQSLATVTLWMATFYLEKHKKCYWLTLVPAGFITSVCVTYILYDKIGFRLPLSLSTAIGTVVAVLCVVSFIFKHYKTHKINSK